MRVIVVGPHYTAPWVADTRRALQELGHEAKGMYYDFDPNTRKQVIARIQRAAWRVPPRLRKSLGRAIRTTVLEEPIPLRRWKPGKELQLIQAIKSFSPDLFIVLKGEVIPKATLERIRSHLSGAMVSWWVDDPFHYPEAVECFNLYDAFFVFDRSYMPSLRNLGLRSVEYLPCACDPSRFRRKPLSGFRRSRRSYDVAFVGTFYPERGPMIRQLRGLDVAIWGPAWQFPEALPYLEGFDKHVLRGVGLNLSEAAEVYRDAKINLNRHHCQTHLGGLNTRTFEVLASGGFELVDHVSGIEDLLKPGEEIACYDSEEHLRDAVEYYLARPEERARIIRQGRDRVLREHTYRHRVERLLEVLSLARSA